jgi:three-Cys-motif partner protein
MSRIELNRIKNPACSKRCNKDQRQSIAENDSCSLVRSINDNLQIRCVGEWAEQKIYLLYQYFGIFSAGMKNKWNLNYIEICSGPGKCINRQNGNEFDGTALSIINHENFKLVNKAYFFDYDQKTIDTLNIRIANLGYTHKALALRGDYNDPSSICNVLQYISKDSLNLVFIDPTDCSVPFTLIEKVKEALIRVDLIINVATGTDFNRNIPMAFSDKQRAVKYARFLGSSDFFKSDENINLCKKKDYPKLRSNFRKAYIESLKRIGYKYFDYTSIKSFYDILFASSNEKGFQFWKKATQKIDSSGQRTIDFDNEDD